jgi:hypothetical protein
MLDELAILQPENIDRRRAACPHCRNHVVNSDKIALSDESLELDAQIWILAGDHFTKPMNGSGPSPAMGLCWRYDEPAYCFTASSGYRWLKARS